MRWEHTNRHPLSHTHTQTHTHNKIICAFVFGKCKALGHNAGLPYASQPKIPYDGPIDRHFFISNRQEMTHSSTPVTNVALYAQTLFSVQWCFRSFCIKIQFNTILFVARLSLSIHFSPSCLAHCRVYIISEHVETFEQRCNSVCTCECVRTFCCTTRQGVVYDRFQCVFVI